NIIACILKYIYLCHYFKIQTDFVRNRKPWTTDFVGGFLKAIKATTSPGSDCSIFYKQKTTGSAGECV
ncbi:MAG: hypothetical protein PHX30_05880, partial [Candidatus Pacebacteria bacterium]|nr:hypothetical protein [Candidatus Paceibacterota bacterium]